MAEDDIDTDFNTDFEVGFSTVPDSLLDQITVEEITLGESLLTPGLQTSVRVHSYFHYLPVKNLDLFKNTIMSIRIDKAILAKFNIPRNLDVIATTYRLDHRKMINNVNEEFILHGCHQTLLDDAATLVSKKWKCTRPSSVVDEVLASCAGAGVRDIESADPARDYIAENIRPFQVVSQQANVALADGNDPSFLHYMTYQNLGTHHFRSLKKLSQQSPVATYVFQETGAISGHAYPYSILTHNFPCDFDLLSDILNGVGTNGKDLNSLFTINPVMKMFNLFGSETFGCGIGSGLPKIAMSNMGSAQQQNMCPDYSHLYIHKRQARMALLDQNKIALRIMVPWNPMLNAGKVIELVLPNKNDPNGTTLNYGSGTYLIASLKHSIRRRQPAVITMDCVSTTVGAGIV